MRNTMHDHLEFQWANSTRKNLRLCGRVPINKEGFIYLFNNGDSPVISGLMRCGSASACVVCSSRIAMARQKWLSELFESAQDMGYQISMITLTVPHKDGDSLDNLLDAMEASYTNVQGTLAYKDARTLYEAQFIRVLEVTYGKNGFHPHYHIAIIHKPGLNWDIYRREIQDSWCKNIVKDRKVHRKTRINGVYHTKTVEIKGLRRPNEEIAVHILENASNDQRSAYLTKLSGLSALEFTNSKGKSARTDENLNIWQVQALAVEGWSQAKNHTRRNHTEGYISHNNIVQNDKLDRLEEKLAISPQTSEHIKIWQEYENAITGKKLISVSRGLEAKFGVKWGGDSQQADNEFSDESQMPISYSMAIKEPEFIGAISVNIWKQIASRRLVGKLREAIPQGYDKVCEFLDLYDIRGQFYSHEYIRQQYEVIDVLYINRNLNEEIRDYASYDLLQNEINIASTYPDIQLRLESMTIMEEVA